MTTSNGITDGDLARDKLSGQTVLIRTVINLTTVVIRLPFGTGEQMVPARRLEAI